EILSRIGATLARCRIPYMIIGDQAVLFYGEPRLTRDIDITLGANVDSLNTVLEVIKDLSLKPIPGDTEAFVQKIMVLPAVDENTGIRVDFIFSFTPYETGAIKRSRKVEILGQEIAFASPEDVIIHKIFAGRPRDLEDVKSILIRNHDLDTKYIRGWLVEFDAADEETNNYLKSFDDLVRKLSGS